MENSEGAQVNKLIFVVGLYFLVKASLDTLRVVEHFSSYNLNTAYAAGFATGQIMAPLLFLMGGVLLIRHSWLARSSASKQASAA
ncbi:MAG: hypothetical protein KGQ84_05890 [Proteobacteria bacterium]|nr:hypothetical protein [Pseudomonadota bacterium]